MIVCAQCGAIKREVNHWFIAWTEKQGRKFCFISMDTDPSMANRSATQSLCGQSCLHRAIQKHIDLAERSRARSLEPANYSTILSAEPESPN